MKLARTEECNQEWHGEIYTEAMEDGHDDETLTRITGNDGEGSVHRGGTTYADRCQSSKILRQQWGTQQGENLSADVGKQSDGTKFCPTVLGDEDARQRVVAESRTYRQTVGKLTMPQ